MKSSKTVDLYCSCRMPGESNDMAECDSCHVWYHRHCMDIPMFDKEEDIYWECKACCAKDTP